MPSGQCQCQALILVIGRFGKTNKYSLKAKVVNTRFAGSKSVHRVLQTSGAVLAYMTCAMPSYHAIFLYVLGICIAIPQKLCFPLDVVNSMFTCVTSLQLHVHMSDITSTPCSHV